MSFDSTAISTYSSTIREAAWGKAKQNPELRQVNCLPVCDHASGDVLYAFNYDGSIPDRTILPTICQRMLSAGFDLQKNILVTDRGFQSIYNTQRALNPELKYIRFLQVNESGVKTKLRHSMPALTNAIAHRYPSIGMTAVRVKDEWSQDTECGRIEAKAYVHLYRNGLQAEMEVNRLHKLVEHVCQVKTEERNLALKERREERENIEQVRKTKGNQAAEKLIEEYRLKRENQKQKKSEIDDETWRKCRKYIIENKRAKENEAAWLINFNALSADVEFAGCHAIRTNTETNPPETFQIYKQREIIEQGFRQLKNEVHGSRFYATESSYRGKLFVYTPAQAIRMSMLMTAKAVSKDSSLKMPEESLRKLLLCLQHVTARKHKTTDAFIIGTVLKRYRDLLALFGIEKPPATVYR